MADEDKAKDVGGNPDGNSPSNTQVQAAGNQSEPSSQNGQRSQKEAGTASDVASEIRRGEQWVIGLQLLTLFFTALTAWIYYGQLQEMVGESGQTDALTRSYRRLADSAGRQAEASKVIAEQASTQAIQTTNLATDTHALAVSAGKQADAAKVQSQAAVDLATQTKTLATTAQQQLTSSERPWMKVGLALNTLPGQHLLPGQTGPVFIDKNGLHVSVLIEGKNVGASPATHVYVMTDLTPSNKRPVIERKQQELCDAMHDLSLSIDFNMGEGDTVFPGDPYLVPQYTSLSAKVIASELQRPSNRTFRGADGTMLVMGANDDSFDEAGIMAAQQLGMLPAPSVYVVGCLDYTVDFSSVRHQTPFFFELQGIDLRNPSASQIVLRKNYMWGNSAN